jgi:small subunit ribosomal protein S2
MYCDLISGAVLDGISQEMQASGQDMGAVEDLTPEIMPELAPEMLPAEAPVA